MNAPFRFIHTADLHLDSPLKSLARRDEALASHVQNATRATFSRIIDLCLEEQVDALLIAGDIYDSQYPSVATVGFFIEQLNRLADTNTPVFLIRGNHDYYADLANVIPLPAHVTEFVGNKKSVTLDKHGVAIHGVSFKKEHATESALRSFKAPDESLINIAMLHTSLGGAEGHDIYAPCSESELDTLGFDYWALGHIHKRLVAGTQSTIVMPGIPQGRDMGESGAKSVTLAALNVSECHIEERHVNPIRFERVFINLNQAEKEAVNTATTPTSLEILTAAYRDVITNLKTSYPDVERWIVRVICTSGAAAQFPLKQELEHTEEALNLVAESIGAFHLDKIEFQIQQDQSSPSTASDTLLNQLKTIISEHVNDESLYQQSQKEFDNLVKLLPTKASRDSLQKSEEHRHQQITELQADGVNELLSMIQTERRLGE